MYVIPVLGHVYAVAAVITGTSFTAPFDSRKPNTSADRVVNDNGIMFLPATPHSALVSASFIPTVPGGSSLTSLFEVTLFLILTLRVDMLSSFFSWDILVLMESPLIESLVLPSVSLLLCLEFRPPITLAFVSDTFRELLPRDCSIRPTNSPSFPTSFFTFLMLLLLSPLGLFLFFFFL